MEDDEEQTGFDRYGEAYRDWWAPIIAPAAVRLLDRLEGLITAGASPRVVDIGVGTGTLAIAVLERWPGAVVVGIDSSRVMLELARVEASRRGDALARRLDLLHAPAESLTLPDASADVVVSSFVIQLVSNRAAALREMKRVLAPGGLLALLTWQADDEPFAPDEILWRAFDELKVPATASGGPRPYRSPGAAAAEVRRAGFREVQAVQAWLDHRFTPRSYLDLAEHWLEDDTFAELEPRRAARLRRLLLSRFERLRPAAMRWRRPLISVVGRAPGA